MGTIRMASVHGAVPRPQPRSTLAVTWRLARDPCGSSSPTASSIRASPQAWICAFTIAADASGTTLLLHRDADAAMVRLHFGGRLFASTVPGNLAALATDGGVWQCAPRCFVQEKNGGRTGINGSFVLHSDHEVGFSVPTRPKGSTLIIDPELVFGSYLAVEPQTCRPDGRLRRVL